MNKNNIDADYSRANTDEVVQEAVHMTDDERTKLL